MIQWVKLRSVLMEPFGEQYAVINGVTMILVLFVDTWDIHLMVIREFIEASLIKIFRCH